MVKLKGPLFSQSASGEIGKAIQFVCGHFARAKPDIPPPSTEQQKTQQARFLEGANIWSETLSDNIKENWKDFKKIIISNDKCVGMPYNTSGYNLWQLYYLKYGVDGWVDYPNPPS